MAAIHGDKGTLRIIENGAVVRIFEVTDWSVSEDSNVEKRHYAGEKTPRTRKNVMGWRGRVTLDVVSAELDLFVQRINDAEDLGVGVPQVAIALVEQYDDRDRLAGQPDAVTHIFSDVVVIYDEHRGGGKPDLMQKSFSFEAARKRTEAL